MRLVNLDDCNRDLFYKQMGGKDSLITVERAFDMLMALPLVNIDKIEIINNLIAECDTFDIKKCYKCQRYNSIEVHGRQNENTMTFVYCPYGNKEFEYIPSEGKNVRVDRNQ